MKAVLYYCVITGTNTRLPSSNAFGVGDEPELSIVVCALNNNNNNHFNLNPDTPGGGRISMQMASVDSIDSCVDGNDITIATEFGHTTRMSGSELPRLMQKNVTNLAMANIVSNNIGDNQNNNIK